MRSFVTRLVGPCRILVVILSIMIGTALTAHAAVISYFANLSGPNESPPNASAGTGTASVDVDATTHTMHVHVTFSGLTGNTTASHIHAPTAVPGSGTASVATTVPTFAGFPLGVTAGTYDNTLDMTLSSSYNPSYLAANGGTPASAEAALFQSIADTRAYLNIHSNIFGGGEIRGFLIPLATPASRTTWGRVKTLYR